MTTASLHYDSLPLQPRRRSASALSFPLFILVNAALFVRPAELITAADGLPIYKVIICLCLAVTLNPVFRQLTRKDLVNWPISLCVVGLLFAVILSHLCHFNFESAWSEGTTFFQIILYYLLLVALVNSPAHMQKFLLWLNVFTLLLTIVALLDYHGYIHFAKIIAAQETLSTDGKFTKDVLTRLAATGIFGNPNDLSRILVIGITICIFAITEKGGSQLRFLWVGPLAVFIYALMLTYSRGGLLALVAGLAVLFACRYGWRKTIFATIIVVPIFIALFGGRQTDFNASQGTGQERIQLWAEGFERLKQSPFFGIGTNKLSEEIGLVAHNSYVQAYVEMGFLGGTFFTGAFFLSLWCIYRLGNKRPATVDPELWRLRPYVLSIVAGTIVGMLTSTRTYTLPTYMVLGLAAAYIRLTADAVPDAHLRVNKLIIRKLCLASLLVFMTTYIYIRLSVHWE
jgi:O-antigen ligase